MSYSPYAIENTITPTSTTSTTTTSSTTSTTTSSTTPSSSSTTTRARVREEWQQTIELVMAEAEQSIGQRVTPYIRQELVGWLHMMAPEVIIYALHETARAPRPAWRYTQAILARCREQGITDSVMLSMQSKPAAAKPGKTVREQQYSQREYEDTDEMPAWMMRRWEEMNGHGQPGTDL